MGSRFSQVGRAPRKRHYPGNAEAQEVDDYAIVTAKLAVVRERSITVERLSPRIGRATLARSLLHGADDLALISGDAKPGEEWTFRLRAWKAKEEGLA